jgi:hypothetical protein
MHRYLKMLVLLFLLSNLLLAIQATKYNVIPRQSERYLNPSSASPQMISFDGDLDYILEQALMKAGETLSPQLSDAPSSAPSDSTSPSLPLPSTTLDVNKCQDSTIEHLEILRFQYSMETAIGANVTVVIGEIEEKLLEAIAPIVLSCRSALKEFLNIVAIDAVPADIPSATGTPEMLFFFHN